MPKSNKRPTALALLSLAVLAALLSLAVLETALAVDFGPGSGDPVDAQPVTANALDDEFTATTISGNWTLSATASVASPALFDTTYTTSATWRYSLTLFPGWIAIQSNANGGSYMSMSKAWTENTNDILYIHFRQQMGPSTTVPQSYINLQVQDGSSRYFQCKISGLVPTLGGSAGAATGTSTYLTQGISHLAISKQSNAYFCFFRSPGSGWNMVGAGTSSPTDFTNPTTIIVEFANNNATNALIPTIAIDYFRVIANSIVLPGGW